MASISVPPAIQPLKGGQCLHAGSEPHQEDDRVFTAALLAINELRLMPERDVHWEAALCGIASFFV